MKLTKKQQEAKDLYLNSMTTVSKNRLLADVKQEIDDFSLLDMWKYLIKNKGKYNCYGNVDINGELLEVGDKVVYEPTQYKGLVKGYVSSFSKTLTNVMATEGYDSASHRYPNQIVKNG